MGDQQLKSRSWQLHRALFNSLAIAKGFAFILGLVLIGYFLEHSDLGNTINEDWIDRHIRHQGLSGILLFLAAGGLFTAAGLPRQVIAFLGGYAFGLLSGTLLSTLAALVGSLLAFFFARSLGRNLLQDRLGQRAARYDRFIHEHPFALTLLVRLLPVGSNILTNLAAGMSSARPIPFLLASFIGYLPQSLVFALVGSGITVAPALRIGIAVVLLPTSFALGAWLYHRYRHGLSIDGQVDSILGETD
ncbi:MAG TPA: VTT domain-containing protein [Pseudomonadales bacterium]|nr:VTT domain-containing protein [Pseudomonadales bacterium]